MRKLTSLLVVMSLVAACGISAQSQAPSATSSGPTSPPAATTAPATSGATTNPSSAAPETPGASEPAPDTAAPATPEGPLPTNTGKVVWGNWPAYMQFSRRTGTFPMIDKFIQDTG